MKNTISPFKILSFIFAKFLSRRPVLYCSSGYPYFLDKQGKRVWVHRFVAEKALKRRLKRGEHVHHINGKILDNRRVNLCVLSKRNHLYFHRWYSYKKTRERRAPLPREQLKKLKELGGRLL
jgi:hypothetical protein